MDALEFGELLLALRKAYGWSQQKLAEEAGIHYERIKGIKPSEKIIFAVKRVQDLEKGSKVNVDPDAFVALADALRLNALEKKEFFLAAARVDAAKMLGGERNHDEVYTFLKDFISTARQPAFVCDVYGDVILANLLITEFLGIPPTYIDEAQEKVEYYNMLYVICAEESRYSSLFSSAEWLKVVERNVQFLKRISLRYRHKTSFTQCLNRLLKLKVFKACWEAEPDSGMSVNYSDVEQYSYKHPKHGDLQYTATISSMTTQCGELYLTVYSATNENTAQVFDVLYKELEKVLPPGNTMCLELAPWPKLDMLEKKPSK